MESKIIQGDCIQIMKTLDEDSVDAIITDPPYGLEFMGKEWDSFKSKGQGDGWQKAGKPSMEKFDGKNDWHSKPRPAFRGHTLEHWKNMQQHFFEFGIEAIRILKPGAFMLIMGGTRTYHRMVCGIEDAGFEIRDTIMWLYGSGFPKSLNIGKQIDKDNGKGENLIRFTKWFDNLRKEKELTYNQIDGHLGLDSGGATANHYCGWNTQQPRFPRLKFYYKLKEWLKFGDEWDEIIKEAEREVVGKSKWSHQVGIPLPNTYDGKRQNLDITTPNLPEAKQWEGWGTALKPACEPIVIARKPLSEKNVALNVLKWGTGGINIDECRIGTEKHIVRGGDENTERFFHGGFKQVNKEVEGRFPANIILDEEAGKMLDEQSGDSKSSDNDSIRKSFGGLTTGLFDTKETRRIGYVDKGGASRFFYCAKASKSERNFGCEEIEEKYVRRDDGQPYGMNTNKFRPDGSERKEIKPKTNSHPTVKPIRLMEYLVKLVSKEGATILDPFLGSGTTAIACLKLNRKFIGIEKEEEYIKIAQARIKPYKEQVKLVL